MDKSYQIAFEQELKELGWSPQKLSACLIEKKGMENFLSKTTLEMIRKLRGEDDVATRGEIREVAVLFTDVRGFTRFAETFSVEKVFEIINAYLSAQSKHIASHGGIIDKFLGDGIMATFEGEHKAWNAFRAAIAIQQAVRELNYDHTERAVLNIGIGIHTGPVFMGVLGEEGRKDYTAIGDNVNIASRLCSQAKGGEILFTEQFKHELPDIQGAKFKEMMKVKGKKMPLQVFHYELDIGYHLIRSPVCPGNTALPADSVLSRSATDSPRHISDSEEKRELTRKEKELIAVGASVVSGCQQCADYHFVKVFEEGATVSEVSQAVHDAVEMISYASLVMQNKAYTLMNMTSDLSENVISVRTDRISLLIRISAVVALNCLTGIGKFIESALQLGVTIYEIRTAISLAKVVAAKAREFADDKIRQTMDIDDNTTKYCRTDYVSEIIRR